jgi:hypothetical protein
MNQKKKAFWIIALFHFLFDTMWFIINVGVCAVEITSCQYETLYCRRYDLSCKVSRTFCWWRFNDAIWRREHGIPALLTFGTCAAVFTAGLWRLLFPCDPFFAHLARADQWRQIFSEGVRRRLLDAAEVWQLWMSLMDSFIYLFVCGLFNAEISTLCIVVPLSKG